MVSVARQWDHSFLLATCSLRCRWKTGMTLIAWGILNLRRAPPFHYLVRWCHCVTWLKQLSLLDQLRIVHCVDYLSLGIPVKFYCSVCLYGRQAFLSVQKSIFIYNTYYTSKREMWRDISRAESEWNVSQYLTRNECNKWFILYWREMHMCSRALDIYCEISRNISRYEYGKILQEVYQVTYI